MDVSVTLDKEQMKKVFAIGGCVNAKTYELNGTLYMRGTLRFVGFIGKYNRDGLYDGVFDFEIADVDDTAVEAWSAWL